MSYSKIKRSYFGQHVPKMVSTQNVLLRSQLDIPKKKCIPGGPIGTFSGKVSSWGSNLEPVQEEISSWGSNLEPIQKSQVLGVQFGTYSGKISSWGSKIHIPYKKNPGGTV